MEQYSVNEAADLLGLRTRQVRRAIREGELDAEADGRDYLINREDLEAYADDQGIELDADDLEDFDDRVEGAIEEHRGTWEAGFRSGFAAGTQEDEDD